MGNNKKAHDFHVIPRTSDLLSTEQPIHEAIVQKYFEESGPIYDDAIGNPFWRLSRALIFDFLEDYAVNRLMGQGATYLDAGGGTGLLAFHVLEKDPTAKVTLFDLSSGMLQIAEKKRAESRLEDRLTLIQGNLTHMFEVSDNKYDVVMSANNVLGFIYDSESAMKEMSRVAKPGAPIIMTAVPNAYHGIFYNVSVGRIEEVRRIKTYRVGTFTDVMPDIHFFTPQLLVNLFESAGIVPVICTGSPITVYPGSDDTDARLVSEKVRGLANPAVWNSVYQIEKDYVSRLPIPGTVITEHAARGNALLIAGYKLR